MLFCPAPLGRAVTQTYTSLWKNQATQDPADLTADLNGMFIPVGTVGDPVYNLADLGSADGLVPQLYFNEPTCAKSGFAFPTCQSQGASEISPCTPSTNLSFTQKHGVVMNCQGVIKVIASIVGESA